MEFHLATFQEHRDLALALEAAGIPYQSQQAPNGFLLFVSDHDAAAARAEFDAVTSERRAVAAPVATRRESGSGWPGVIVYGVVLMLFFAMQQQRVFNLDWAAAGKIDSRAIRQGEVWRAATALTLHADLVHLLGNVIIGGMVGFFAGQVFGAGLSWFCILLAGVVGNLVSAALRPDGHTALGASTAVFAGIGLLSARQWVSRRGVRDAALVRFAPIVGGVVLLSMLGTGGGERTDVLSHVTGFVAGLAGGAMLGAFDRGSWQVRSAQGLWGMAAMTIVTMAWYLAIRNR